MLKNDEEVTSVSFGPFHKEGKHQTQWQNNVNDRLHKKLCWLGTQKIDSKSVLTDITLSMVRFKDDELWKKKIYCNCGCQQWNCDQQIDVQLFYIPLKQMYFLIEYG